jgi:hypothetical protein
MQQTDARPKKKRTAVRLGCGEKDKSETSDFSDDI